MKKYVVYGEETVWFTRVVEADSLEEAKAIVNEAEENAELLEFFGGPKDGNGIRVIDIQSAE